MTAEFEKERQEGGGGDLGRTKKKLRNAIKRQQRPGRTAFIALYNI